MRTDMRQDIHKCDAKMCDVANHHEVIPCDEETMKRVYLTDRQTQTLPRSDPLVVRRSSDTQPIGAIVEETGQVIFFKLSSIVFAIFTTISTPIFQQFFIFVGRTKYFEWLVIQLFFDMAADTIGLICET
eukprot:Selendium_serpulae@DN5744_c4_g1_i11.p1